MRVISVGQENNTNRFSVTKAALTGGVAGTLVGRYAPLTKDEIALYFNSSAKESVLQKVKKVRSNEIEKIIKEVDKGSLKLNLCAFDTFAKHKDQIIENPKKSLEIVEDSADEVKKAFTGLVSRVSNVGMAKEHIETSAIKNAAKSQRPLSFFMIAGAFLAMTAQVLINSFKSEDSKKNIQEKIAAKPTGELTMADVLLEGLGSNAEVLYLTEKNS